eukprot:3648581-Pleurochrysis_carterae.AAC.2
MLQYDNALFGWRRAVLYDDKSLTKFSNRRPDLGLYDHGSWLGSKQGSSDFKSAVHGVGEGVMIRRSCTPWPRGAKLGVGSLEPWSSGAIPEFTITTWEPTSQVFENIVHGTGSFKYGTHDTRRAHWSVDPRRRPSPRRGPYNVLSLMSSTGRERPA